MTTVPSDFYDTIIKTFDSAVESGDLIYSKTTSKDVTVDGLNYNYAIIPGLASKPTAEDNEAAAAASEEKEEEAEESSSKPFDPFDPPLPALLVLDEFMSDYAVVLNKFAVVPRHFLLVTREFQPQNAPLNPSDLEASYLLLKAANAQSGKRHIGFFNCGPDSGASVTHRHIQFLVLPDGFKPFPDEVATGKAAREYKDGQRPLTHDLPSFAHFIVPIHETDKDDLGFRFSTLLSRGLTTLRKHNAKSISYNFLFTEEWFMVVPRSAEGIDGLSINAVGAIGLLLAKGDEELKYIEEKGPSTILASVGFPSHSHDEVEYDY